LIYLPELEIKETSFLWLKALWMVSFKRVFNLSCGRMVYRVEKSKVLMEDTWENDLDFTFSKRVLGYNSTYFSNKIQKVKHATPRNKWSVCWSSSSITYLSPLGGNTVSALNCSPIRVSVSCVFSFSTKLLIQAKDCNDYSMMMLLLLSLLIKVFVMKPHRILGK
jgi:hypothetical protein